MHVDVIIDKVITNFILLCMLQVINFTEKFYSYAGWCIVCEQLWSWYGFLILGSVGKPSSSLWDCQIDIGPQSHTNDAASKDEEAFESLQVPLKAWSDLCFLEDFFLLSVIQGSQME